MLTIKKRYIINEKQEKVAVQLDIETFKKIEEFLEDHAFAKIMRNNKKKDGLNIYEAHTYYKKLRKAK